MSNTSTIREQLTYKAGLQIIFILFAILLTVFYTNPTLTKVRENIETANSKIESYNDLNENGIKYAVLKNKIKSVGGYDALIAVIDENAKDAVEGSGIPKVETIIKKNSNEKYLDWLTGMVKNLTSEKQQLQEEKKKINTILPTLSPISDSTDENSITLRNYISYVEKNILKRFNIYSFTPLGITGINYDENQKNTKNPIGNFQVEIGFNTSNGNIIKLLDYIKTSGNPQVLENDYQGEVGGVMSNPLVTLNSLIINDQITTENNKTINGKLTLSFYIRGGHETDKAYLLETLTRIEKELENKIKGDIKICETSGTCSNIGELEKISKKLEELNKGFKNAYEYKKKNTMEAMYLLTQQINSIKSIEEQYKSIK